MEAEHVPRTCKWASLTLLLDSPLWLDAWSWQWSCYSHDAFRPLICTNACKACPRWEPRDRNAQGGVGCERE